MSTSVANPESEDRVTIVSREGSNGHKPKTEPMPDLPPHSEDAEKAVLGSILINPSAFLECHWLKQEDFFLIRNGLVWEAMERLHGRGDAIDYLPVIEELKAMGKLDEIGGAAYITYLLSSTATAKDATTYARIVERAGGRRKMLGAAEKIRELALEEDKDFYTLHEQGRTFYDAALPRRMATAGILPASLVFSDWFDVVEDMYNNKKTPGIPTGFHDLDMILGGLFESDLYIVAARPGMGKTSLLCNLAMKISKTGKHGVFFSLEMASEAIMGRLVSLETGISTTRWRWGNMRPDEMPLVVKAAKTFRDLRLDIDDTPAQGLSHIRSKCQMLKAQGRLDYVLVDYLQYVTPAKTITGDEKARWQAVGETAHGLKQLARELKVPVVAAAQLSRAVEQRPDKHPIMSDLSESGRIEQDADCIMFLYRDDKCKKESDRPNQMDIIIAKHRNGPTGTASFYFRDNIVRIVGLKKTDVDLAEV